MSSQINQTLKLKHQQLLGTTGKNKLTKPSSYKTTDLLIIELADLLNPSYHKWYCLVFFKLGKERVLDLASQARVDGRLPAKLFSHLLKLALAQHKTPPGRKGNQHLAAVRVGGANAIISQDFPQGSKKSPCIKLTAGL